jgi:hypothetical protein
MAAAPCAEVEDEVSDGDSSIVRGNVGTVAFPVGTTSYPAESCTTTFREAASLLARASVDGRDESIFVAFLVIDSFSFHPV